MVEFAGLALGLVPTPTPANAKEYEELIGVAYYNMIAQIYTGYMLSLGLLSSPLRSLTLQMPVILLRLS